jgi:nucleotide-binding universal stress UspA family protein
MKGYRKILIASQGADKALRQGIQLAKDEKSWITVVKVIPPNEGDLNLTGIKNIKDVLESNAGNVTREIDAVAQSERGLIKTRLEQGLIHEKIVAVAEEEKCDLIVMGNEKTGWLKRLFRGNIVEKVINRAPCPVLLVGA